MKDFYKLLMLFCFSTSTLDVLASEYNRFCSTQAQRHISDLDRISDHTATVKKIEKLKDNYNKNLAEDTVSSGVKNLNDKFLTNKDYSSSLILDMIVAMIEDTTPKAKNFEELCKKTDNKVKLCALPYDKRESVTATFANFKLACAQTECEKISDVKNIQAELLEEYIKSRGTLDPTPELIASLNQNTQTALEDTEERKKIKEQIRELQKGHFADIETLKRYVGEKYLRSCSPQAEPTEVISNCGASGVPQIFDIKISDDHFKIMGALSSKQGASSIFSKAEIKNYKEVCDKNKSLEGVKPVCELIYKDFAAIREVKEPKDWEEIHKNNYVVSDPSHPEGFRIVPKKRNSEMFLEAFAPLFNNFVPFWIYNIQMESQISMMTQQAVWQKQYGAFYSNGYFQANYLPTPTTTPSLSGFNFAQ